MEHFCHSDLRLWNRFSQESQNFHLNLEHKTNSFKSHSSRMEDFSSRKDDYDDSWADSSSAADNSHNFPLNDVKNF